LPHCDDVGHDIREHLTPTVSGLVSKEHCVRTIHAELNAILQAAKDGVSVDGATLYCWMTPCRNCAMAIIRVGIVRVVAQYVYQDAEDTIDMFTKCGIHLEHICDQQLKYK